MIRGEMKLRGKGETNSQVAAVDTILEGERVEPYGITTKPPTGNEGFIIYTGGTGEGVHFLTTDKQEKPEIEEGEIAVYSSKENYLKIGKEVTTIVRGEMEMTITPSGKLSIKNQAGDLMKLLTDLITELASHQTPTLLGPQATPSAIKFTEILTKLQGVLE